MTITFSVHSMLQSTDIHGSSQEWIMNGERCEENKNLGGDLLMKNSVNSGTVIQINSRFWALKST